MSKTISLIPIVPLSQIEDVLIKHHVLDGPAQAELAWYLQGELQYGDFNADKLQHALRSFYRLRISKQDAEAIAFDLYGALASVAENLENHGDTNVARN